MAKGRSKPTKEKKKPKKNANITTKRAMYDNQLIGIGNSGISRGY